MIMLLVFALGFLGGLTYARVKLITWLLLFITVLLAVGWLNFSI